MQEGKIEYAKYDTVEIVKPYKKFTIRVRGFLNCNLWVSEGFSYRTANIQLITSSKGKLKTAPMYGSWNLLTCRMVLFEKYIMNESKIKKVARQLSGRIIQRHLVRTFPRRNDI